MIDLGSIQGLLEHDHGLAAYCPCCDRWAVLDSVAMIGVGHGSRHLQSRVRCRDCGKPGNLQVRPPITVRCSFCGSAKQPQATLL